MNWQHLTYFQTVAETENFTQAAKILYVTPSALSKAIHSLEAELGFPLFTKSGRNSVLTDYGRSFKTYVDRAMGCITDGLNDIHEQMNQISGPVNLAGVYTMCSEYLPGYLKDFLFLYPNVKFSMVYQITSDILNQLLSEKIDLGFCGDYELEDRRYSSIEYLLLKKEELVIITSEAHPLSQQSFVTISELKEESFIIYRNVNSGISLIFWELCKNAGVNPKIAFELPDDQNILSLVSAGLGIALIADTPMIHRPDIHILRFSGDPPVRNQYMVWKKDHFLSPAGRAFRDFIQKADS